MLYFFFAILGIKKFEHKKNTHTSVVCVWVTKWWGEVWCDDDKGAKSWIYCCQKMDKTKKDINLLKPNTPTPKALNSSTAYPKRQAGAHEAGLQFWEN